MNRKRAKLLSLLLAGALVLPGCSAPPDYEQKRRNLIQKLEELSQVNALDEAEAVLDELAATPGGEAEAAYGRAMIQISRSFTPVANIFATFYLLFNEAESLKLAPSGVAPLGSDYSLTVLVHDLAERIRRSATDYEKLALETVAEYPDGSITFDNFVLYVGPLPMFKIGAEIDRADLHIFRGIENILFEMAANLILSIELGVSLPQIKDMQTWITSNPECQWSIWNRNCWLALTSYMLSTYPDMLSLADDGEARVEAVLDSMATAAESLITAMELIAAETDPQGDDYFVILPPGQGTAEGTDDDEYEFRIQHSTSAFEFWTSEVFATAMLEGRSLINPDVIQKRAVEDTVSTMSERALDDLNTMIDHMRNGGGVVALQTFARPIIEMFAAAIFWNQGLNSFLEQIVPGSESIENSIVASGISFVELVELAMDEMFPPGLIGLDFHTAMHNPRALRDMVPYYGYSPPGVEESLLAIEWECDYDFAWWMICRRPPTDGPRFVGTPYELAADSIAERVFYISLQDPTLGNWLYLNPTHAPVTEVAQTLPGAKDELVPATNRTLNFVLHRVVEYIMETFLGN